MSEKVLVALSGGVDSAIAAQMLIEQGYEVFGVHFQFTDEDITYLKEISDILGIAVIKYDARDLFRKEVIAYFTQFHLAGKTPSPCTYCNPHVKWKLLLSIADQKKLKYIATGHYINLEYEEGLFRIYKGSDTKKDQSYYLWDLNQKALSRTLSPMGQQLKTSIKEQAAKSGLLALAKKRESAGLCFSKNGSCVDMLQSYLPYLKKKIKRGIIINRNGQEIGYHDGYMYYTVGQKKGLALETEEKLCVARIDAKNNILEVDTWQNLYKKEFSVTNYRFADISELYNLVSIQVKIRGFGLNPEGSCRISKENESNTLRIHLENPAWAPAPGQPAVFYSGDKLLGGGIIC